MQSDHDTEAGHILTHLSSGAAYPGTSVPNLNQNQNQNQNQQQQLTPSSSAPVISPSSSQRLLSPGGNQGQIQGLNQDGNANGSASASGNGSAVKRSRQRPTKSCEECRRKKLKCDRELPCSNCKKGGRDGGICYFKDAPGGGEFGGSGTGKRLRTEELEGGWGERGRRPYVGGSGAGGGYGDGSGEEERGEDRGYYPNVPQLTRNDPIGPGRGILAYGMHGADPELARGEAARARGFQQMENQRRALSGEDIDPYSSVPRARTDNGFGRAMFTYDASPEARKDEMATPVSSAGLAQSETGVRSLGKLHVKGSRSRYVGIGDRMAMLDHFGTSKGFILKSFKDPELSGLVQELAAYQNAFQPKDKTRHVLPQDRDEFMVEMIKALPSSFLFGILQARYIQNWETLWRVLHIGTFMKECDQVSQVIESGSSSLPAHINDWVIPQILAIISTASRLNDPNERGSTTERISDDQITKNCVMIKGWLDSLQGKSLVNFPVLQTRTLLLLARQANLANPAELWVESGILVRHAMVMGVHQDPEPWEFSPFDREARRKLWLTIVELDLQFSLAAGMPSSVFSNIFNIRQILNVDDQDLTPEMSDYPSTKPTTIYTDALPQLALAASLPLRIQITNLLGSNLNLATSAPHLLRLATDLETHLSALPPSLRSASSNKRLHRFFTSIQLELSIRRPLLALYRTISMSEIGSKHPEARKGAVRNALSILGNLDALDPAVADLSVVKGREYLNLFHILHRNSILQSALVLCYEIKLSNSSSTSTSSASPHELEAEKERDIDWGIGQSRVSFTRVVENTVTGMLERIGEWGCDLKDILPLAVALSAVRCDGDEVQRRDMMRRATERVRDACRVARPDVLVRFRSGSREGEGAFGWRGRDGCGEREREKEKSEVVQPWSVNVVNSGGGGILGEGIAFDGFDPMQDFGFENMDFGFLDWGTNQSWL
ncbi:hypothetical protein L207DRAFT_634685 [Hyaloscypha variabilis F]|uniref:Zn(2)-C6 fungal-type domain-containing protein n=1 Tax=Hyaloscypha variabilis (strain UAMH 11265 / GT02V1 / F) TaxID=1149755 RepID=A0A2J6RJJ3_HYAVF|nr:hypothetical protein L207DRAFT_634685 [Hyaloscypha variabilis F]